ncbi:MAG: AI-2E family transporter, partial [Pseudomonadota bacterium]|nr:AI-2E family transporter [Pseudomonadota bacterium]
LMAYGRMPRWVSIGLVFLLITSAVVAAAWVFVPMIWNQLMFAKDNIPDAVHWINGSFRVWIEQTLKIQIEPIDPDQASNAVLQYLQTNYNVSSIQAALGNVARSGLSAINVVVLTILVPIVTFYFLLDWRGMLQRIQMLLPRRIEPKVVHVASECHQVLGQFVKGQLLVMFLLGVIYAVGLQLVGIQVGLIIGLVAGLASIIPYLGFAVGLTAAIVACLLQFGLSWVHLGLVGMVFMLGQVIEGYVLQPFLLGDKIGLSPVAVIFAIMAGAQLFGFAGMLLALPVAAVLVVLFRHAYHSYEHSPFYQYIPAHAVEPYETVFVDAQDEPTPSFPNDAQAMRDSATAEDHTQTRNS